MLGGSVDERGASVPSSHRERNIIVPRYGWHPDAEHARHVGQGNSGIYPALTVHANERISADSGDVTAEYFDSTRVARRRRAGGSVTRSAQRDDGSRRLVVLCKTTLAWRPLRLHARDRSIYRTRRPPRGRSRVPRCAPVNLLRRFVATYRRIYRNNSTTPSFQRF